MDYSKVKFVKPSVSARDITRGKVYPVLKSSESGLMEINDDSGYRIVLFANDCSHLDGAHWIPCLEDGTPLTKELTELEAEMLGLLNRISGELLRTDFVLSEKWYDIITETIKKAKQ